MINYLNYADVIVVNLHITLSYGSQQG